MQLMPDWFLEWVIIADTRDEVYDSVWRLREGASLEIQEEFKRFMEESE